MDSTRSKRKVSLDLLQSQGGEGIVRDDGGHRVGRAFDGVWQLSASFHSKVMLPLRHAATASMKTGGPASWGLIAALLLAGVLVCVCGKIISSSSVRTVSGTIR